MKQNHVCYSESKIRIDSMEPMYVSFMGFLSEAKWWFMEVCVSVRPE